MARPIADRASGRIALLGAASPAGAKVKAALADRGVAGSRVELYGHQSDVAVLSEYDGEARLVQAAGELDAEGCAALFVCEPGHDLDALAAAAATGTLVIDLTASVSGATLAGAPGASPSDRLVAIPHPLTALLGSLLVPIRAAAGLTAVSAFVLRPASDFGEPGLEELREQTVRLLRFESTPTEVFGRQLAFNVLPEHLFPRGEEQAGSRIVHECRVLLGAPELPLSLSLALAPVFYGHAIAAHLATEKPGRDGVIAALRAAPGVVLATDEDLGATLDAPEEPGVTVVRVDAAGPSAFSIWALGSEAGAVAAVRAITVAAGAGVL
jgi:aspartate-semialdehyde dehydrogenase